MSAGTVVGASVSEVGGVFCVSVLAGVVLSEVTSVEVEDGGGVAVHAVEDGVAEELEEVEDDVVDGEGVGVTVCTGVGVTRANERTSW